jgi:hypothetical protein
MNRKNLASREPGFRPVFAGHPRLMLLLTIALAIAAALTMLFVGHAQPNLYQGF